MKTIKQLPTFIVLSILITMLSACDKTEDDDVVHHPLSYYVGHLDEASKVVTECHKSPPQTEKAKSNCLNAEMSQHVKE